jgi:hypothetical protein
MLIGKIRSMAVTFLLEFSRLFSFLDKEYILISTDTNYIQPLQQRSAQVAIRMHTAKKKKRITEKEKAPLQ